MAIAHNCPVNGVYAVSVTSKLTKWDSWTITIPYASTAEEATELSWSALANWLDISVEEAKQNYILEEPMHITRPEIEYTGM